MFGTWGVLQDDFLKILLVLVLDNPFNFSDMLKYGKVIRMSVTGIMELPTNFSFD